MKFMVTWSVRPDLLKPAVTRFLSSGGPVPQGVKTLGRWHKADGSGGFHLLETVAGSCVAVVKGDDEAALFTSWRSPFTPSVAIFPANP